MPAFAILKFPSQTLFLDADVRCFLSQPSQIMPLNANEEALLCEPSPESIEYEHQRLVRVPGDSNKFGKWSLVALILVSTYLEQPHFEHIPYTSRAEPIHWLRYLLDTTSRSCRNWVRWRSPLRMGTSDHLFTMWTLRLAGVRPQYASAYSPRRS